MLYRNVPKTGDELSILGFGTMRLPEKDGTIDREKATALIDHAIDRGVKNIEPHGRTTTGRVRRSSARHSKESTVTR